MEESFRGAGISPELGRGRLALSWLCDRESRVVPGRRCGHARDIWALQGRGQEGEALAVLLQVAGAIEGFE